MLRSKIASKESMLRSKVASKEGILRPKLTTKESILRSKLDMKFSSSMPSIPISKDDSNLHDELQRKPFHLAPLNLGKGRKGFLVRQMQVYGTRFCTLLELFMVADLCV